MSIREHALNHVLRQEHRHRRIDPLTAEQCERVLKAADRGELNWIDSLSCPAFFALGKRCDEHFDECARWWEVSTAWLRCRDTVSAPLNPTTRYAAEIRLKAAGLWP